MCEISLVSFSPILIWSITNMIYLSFKETTWLDIEMENSYW